MKKLLRVCVAVGLALGVFLLVGCNDNSSPSSPSVQGGGSDNGGSDARPGDTGNPCDLLEGCDDNTIPTSNGGNGDARPGTDGDPCDLLSCIDDGTPPVDNGDKRPDDLSNNNCDLLEGC